MPLTPFALRPFEETDLDGIMAIEKPSFGEDAWPRRDFLDVARSNEGIFLVAESEAQIVGYCIGAAVEDEGYIASIAVHPDHRGHGVGRGLMTAILTTLQAVGAGAIALHVNVSNEAAIALYRAFGFAVVDTIPRYYLDGSPAYFMVRPATR